NRPALFQPPARRDGPDGLDPAVAGRDELLVQMHRRVGIADDEFDAVADARPLARRLELDGRVFGRQAEMADGREIERPREGGIAAHRLLASIEHDPRLGRPARYRRG